MIDTEINCWIVEEKAYRLKILTDPRTVSLSSACLHKETYVYGSVQVQLTSSQNLGGINYIVININI